MFNSLSEAVEVLKIGLPVVAGLYLIYGAILVGKSAPTLRDGWQTLRYLDKVQDAKNRGDVALIDAIKPPKLHEKAYGSNIFNALSSTAKAYKNIATRQSADDDDIMTSVLQLGLGEMEKLEQTKFLPDDFKDID